MINFVNIFITPPKTFQFDLGVAGKEILTCQFLPLSDRTSGSLVLVVFYTLSRRGLSELPKKRYLKRGGLV